MTISIRQTNYNLSRKRTEALSDLAAYYANTYCPEPSAVYPHIIANALGLPYSLNDYGNAFDGYLENKHGNFHTFLHAKGTDNLYNPRVRFSFAHELGHFIIDEHRNALLNPLTPAHGSTTSLDSPYEVEREADLFAACLLMPEDRLRKDLQQKYNRKPCIAALVNEISDKYQVSYTAAMLRLLNLDYYPIMLVCTHNNKLKWLRYSEDFPFKRLNLDANNEISPNTCAGEYFTDGTKYQKKPETVFAEEWFVLYNNSDQRRKLKEYCIYQESLNQVVSLIWE